MGLPEFFFGLKQYAAESDMGSTKQRLQEMNPKTAQPFFRVIEKKSVAKLIRKGFFTPHIILEEVQGKTIFTFVANRKLRWGFRFLFEGILAACLAIILTYYWIPLAAPIVYASLLAVIFPTMIFLGAVTLLRITQQQCMQNLLVEISDILRVSLKNDKKYATQNPFSSSSWLSTIVPSVLGISLALGAAFFTHTLAWNYWCKGDYKKSEMLCRPVQQIVNFTLGEDNSITADCSYYLAECLRCQQKNAEAASLYESTLRQIETYLGKDHIHAGDNCYGLARACDAQQKYNDAKKFYQRAIMIYSNQFPQHMRIAIIRNRLAMLFLKQGDLANAEREQREALRIDRLYGRNHQGVAENLNDLGCVFYHQKLWQSALETFALSLDLKMKRFGKKHYSLYPTLYNLYLVNEKLQQSEKAKVYRGLAQECFAHYFPKKKITEGADCVKYFAKVFHYLYEVPNYLCRYNAIVSLEGNY